MKSSLRILAITVGLFFATTSFSQTTPSPAKDGATSGTSTASSAKTPASGAKKSSTPADKTGASTTAAAGGGDGKVWVNTKSKTYHCEGTKFYGKTKTGEYMTEANAKAKGNHADHGKACVK